MPHLIDPSDVIARVEAAFAGVTLRDGISLNECEYNDSGGSAQVYWERAQQDERTDWRKVVNETLEDYRVTFSFTDSKGFRFYLPAYMVWTVLNHATSDSIITDSTIWALDPAGWRFEQVPFPEFFDSKQVDAIVLFLRFCAEREDSLDADSAIGSLARIDALSKAS